VLLTPNSELIGHSLIEANFREHHDLIVLGVLRMGKPLEGELAPNRGKSTRALQILAMIVTLLAVPVLFPL